MKPKLFKKIPNPDTMCVECQRGEHLDCEGAIGKPCQCACGMADPKRRASAELDAYLTSQRRWYDTTTGSIWYSNDTEP